MKEKVRTTTFWLGLCGALVIIVDCISGIFNLNIASEMVENIILTVASVLVLLGVITKKNISDNVDSERCELLDELKTIDLVDNDKED